MATDRVTRRTIPTRSRTWAKDLAQMLQTAGLRPNHISIASIVTAAIGALALIVSGDTPDGTRYAMLIVASIMIPLRLLCNMLDGMLAVEGGLQSPTGDLYNELPDRFSDILLIAGAGYAARELDFAVTVGWIAASLAVLTAYVRTLGAAQGLSNHFAGPMAKPQRMHVLIGACLLSLLELVLNWDTGIVFMIALVIIAVGSAVTIAMRLQRIVADLNAR